MLKKSGNKTSKELYKEFQKKSHKDGFITFAMKVIGELEAEGKPVAYHYRAAIRSFLRFTKGKEVSFERLTSKLIVRYDKWLTKEGIVRNTAATYLRTLQTVYNKAKKEGVVEANGQEPFDGVNKSVQKAGKREALYLAKLAIIKKVDLSSDPKLALARDMFYVLCIYARHDLLRHVKAEKQQCPQWSRLIQDKDSQGNNS